MNLREANRILKPFNRSITIIRGEYVVWVNASRSRVGTMLHHFPRRAGGGFDALKRAANWAVAHAKGQVSSPYGHV